jgi:single-strand DNA-binding protein
MSFYFNYYNEIEASGRLTADPELKTVGTNATSLCRFRLACNRRFKRGENWQETTEYFNIAAWGSDAVMCASYLVKGSRVTVKGEQQTTEYTKDGQLRRWTEVKATIIIAHDNPTERQTLNVSDEVEYAEPSPNPVNEPPPADEKTISEAYEDELIPM